MSVLKNLIVSTAACALCAMPIAPALASSHREAPNITKYPKVDNTDLYMFRSYEPGHENTVTIIANFYPDQNPGSGPNYFTMDPNAVYEIHIDNDGDAVEDLTYSFRFTNTLKDGTGIVLPIGGKDVTIPLRHIGPITAADDADLGERENYTVTQITGDRRSGTRANVTATAGGGTSFVKPVDNIASVVRCPFVKMLPMIFSRNRLKIILGLDCHLPFSLFFNFAWVTACRQCLAGLQMVFSRFGKSNLGIGTQS